MADLRSARRYAEALFSVALRLENLDRVHSDLVAVVDTLKANPALRDALESPIYPPEAKKRIWEELLGDSVLPLTLHLLRLIVDKGRSGIEPAVLLAFTELTNEHKGIAEAEVTTAVELAPDLLDELRARLESMTGRSVVLRTQVDPAVIGGVVVRLGDLLLDGSVRGQLQALKTRLAGRAHA